MNEMKYCLDVFSKLKRFPILDLPPQSVEGVQTFIKSLFIKERTGIQKSKHSRHDLQWKFHILASCVDLLVWAAKDDSGLNLQISIEFETFRCNML